MTASTIATPDIVELIKDIGRYTDAANALAEAAFVEDRLRAAIRTKLRPDLSKNKEARLFEGYGPLSSFAGKIDMAYAIGIIDDDVRQDLITIKDIRNEFAHPKRTFTFYDQPEIAVLCRKFSGPAPDNGVSNRDRYAAKVAASIESLEPTFKTDALVSALQRYSIERGSLDSSPEKSPAPPDLHSDQG